MRKSVAMLINLKTTGYSLSLGDQALPQTQGIKDLDVFV